MKRVLTIACVLFLGAGTAWADPIQFQSSPLNAGGDIWLSTAPGGTLVVEDAPINIVGDLDFSAPALDVSGTCAGMLDPTGGCLNLESGAFISFTPTPDATDDPAAGTYMYAAAGSSLIITGNTAQGSGTLLDVIFGTPIIVTIGAEGDTGSIAGSFQVSGAFHPSLAAYFGSGTHVIGGTNAQTFFDFVFNFALQSGHGTISSSSVHVLTEIEQVPEPVSSLLMGLGLLVGGAVARRRMRKAD